MKQGRKIIFAALLLYFIAGSAALLAELDDEPYRPGNCMEGTGGPGGRGRPGGYGAFGGFEGLIMLKDELNLSDSQYTKIKALSEKFAEKRYALRGNRDRDAMHELHEEEQQQLEAVLSSSQLETLKVLPARHRALMMKEFLDLRDEQYTQVLAVLEKYGRQAYELRGTGNFSAMRELHEKERDEIEEILTDEQIGKLCDRHRRGGPRSS